MNSATGTSKFMAEVLAALKPNARVLDVGCGGWTIYELSRARGDLAHFGCDREIADPVPPGATFKRVDLETEPLPFQDDAFDLTVCSHVLEHVPKPVELFAELVRVTRPGGLIYVETPSDRSMTSSWPFAQEWNLILSYYDDPTHISRPWSPQALRRLGIYYGCLPLVHRYDFSLWSLISLPVFALAAWIVRRPDMLVEHWWRATGWVAYALYRKPVSLRGKPTLQYFTFRGKPIGYLPSTISGK